MVPEPDEGRASDLVERAYELTDLAEYATAAEMASRAIELEPDNALAHTVHAWALENLGGHHLDEARAIYENALTLDSAAPWPRTALADLLHRTGSADEAERLYQEVVADDTACLFHDQPRSLEFRGWSLYRLGRLEEAIQTFQVSIERMPGRLSVLFDLALSLLANGQLDEASQAYQVAVDAVRAADVRRRRAPLIVAVEDLEEAIAAHLELADLPSTAAVRELLLFQLTALGPPGTPPSDGPGAVV